MISLVWPFLESYGWFVVIGGVCSYVLYSSLVAPRVEEIRTAKELERRKKFDEDVHAKEAERVAAARERQQLEHDILRAEEKAREEEVKQKKLAELKKAMETESVLKNALATPQKLDTKGKKLTPGEIIDMYINSKPIVMFSKSHCPFCRKAKSVLATFRLSSEHYTYIELDERDDLPGEQIQQEFITRYGSRSVPKVFISGELIGGGDDTVALFQQGVLEELIKTAVAAAAK